MRILFPTDFSEAAEHAFVYALQLAKRTSASIITIHAYALPDIHGVNLPNTLRRVYESISLEEFENYRDSIPMLRTIAEELGATHVDMKHVLQHGEAVPVILKAVQANNIDLVIMGTTGAGFLKELFLGSVAAEVMENADVPVLAIPLGATFDGNINEIAAAAELVEEDEKALSVVLEFAEKFRARVSCVFADVSQISKSSHRVDVFKTKFPEVQFYVLDGVDMEKSVKTFIKDHQIDILAMLIHRRTGLREMFTYSMTKRFSYHIKTPILAIQAHTL